MYWILLVTLHQRRTCGFKHRGRPCDLPRSGTIRFRASRDNVRHRRARSLPCSLRARLRVGSAPAGRQATRTPVRTSHSRSELAHLRSIRKDGPAMQGRICPRFRADTANQRSDREATATACHIRLPGRHHGGWCPRAKPDASGAGKTRHARVGGSIRKQCCCGNDEVSSCSASRNG